MTGIEGERVAALRRVPFLAGIDQRGLDSLATSSRIVKVSRGADLFAEGDSCRGMYLLLCGAMKLYRASPSGREQIVAIEAPGAVIAELPLLDGEPYPVSCAALEESRVLLLPRPAFEELLRDRPEIALEVLRVVGRRLRHLVALVEELSLLGVPQRLAKYLLEIADRSGPSFPLTLSNQEIANRLGTVREIVSRNLHRFEQEGVIGIEGRQIRILDEQALRDRVEGIE
ncbi:MAG: Crp/Fnr family transcriptional regulator [Candidatus Eisenbacteria bacterium]